MCRRIRIAFSLASFLAAILVALPTLAFPPYRSTDAETAPPGELEMRLGLLRFERAANEDDYTSPLLRLNLGLRPGAEIVSEMEYRPEDGQLGDGAIGIKFASPGETINIGMETLALVPVASGQSGVGIESQILLTARRDALALHINAGGGYDPRDGEVTRGWRGSVLVEHAGERGRYGLELFARKNHEEATQARAGLGVIFPMGSFAWRAGVHFGLTSSTPDIAASLWISTQRKLW